MRCPEKLTSQKFGVFTSNVGFSPVLRLYIFNFAMIKLSYKKFERRVFLKNEIKVSAIGVENIVELLKNEKHLYAKLLETITEQVNKKNNH